MPGENQNGGIRTLTQTIRLIIRVFHRVSIFFTSNTIITMPQELFTQPLTRQQALDQNAAPPFHSPQMPPPFFQRNTGGYQASLPSPLSPRSWTFDINVVALADEIQKHNVTRANLANTYMQWANLHKQYRTLQSRCATLQVALEKKEAFVAMSRSWHAGTSIRV